MSGYIDSHESNHEKIILISFSFTHTMYNVLCFFGDHVFIVFVKYSLLLYVSTM